MSWSDKLPPKPLPPTPMLKLPNLLLLRQLTTLSNLCHTEELCNAQVAHRSDAARMFEFRYRLRGPHLFGRPGAAYFAVDLDVGKPPAVAGRLGTVLAVGSAFAPRALSYPRRLD